MFIVTNIFQFICVGTHWGMIHLLDHQGNSIRSKELRAHTVAVNQISIDTNGDYIASCSDDGKVCGLNLVLLCNIITDISFDNFQTIISISLVTIFANFQIQICVW